MVVDAEGVIIDRCLTLDKSDCYCFPRHYKRLRMTVDGNSPSLRGDLILFPFFVLFVYMGY